MELLPPLVLQGAAKEGEASLSGSLQANPGGVCSPDFVGRAVSAAPAHAGHAAGKATGQAGHQGTVRHMGTSLHSDL